MLFASKVYISIKYIHALSISQMSVIIKLNVIFPLNVNSIIAIGKFCYNIRNMNPTIVSILLNFTFKKFKIDFYFKCYVSLNTLLVM